MADTQSFSGAGSNPSGSVRRDLTTSQLALIRRTVARVCTDAEFDEFMAVALQCGLDPMRRQIAPLIVNGSDIDRRRMIPWATIDGLRVIAARQGDYRPMESPPLLELDPERIDAARNPLGLVRAEVRAWKLRHEAWFPVVGEAWWDEFAPLREVFGVDDQGKRSPSGKVTLEASWARMGRVMIAKCAEAQALRRGWPDLLSGLYGEEELHALRLADQTASELLSQRDQLKAIKTDAIWLAFDADAGLQAINRADVGARIRAFYEAADSAAALATFNERNRQSLQIFWEWEPSLAFELKQLAEERLRALEEPVGRRNRTRSGVADARKSRRPKVAGAGGDA